MQQPRRRAGAPRRHGRDLLRAAFTENRVLEAAHALEAALALHGSVPDDRSVERLTDRIAFERRGDELHVVNRLPFLPVAAVFYFALVAVALASIFLIKPDEPDANLLFGYLRSTAIMLPLALWILFMALWSLRGEEQLRLGGERLTVQRRLGSLRLRPRVFEIRRISKMWGEPYTRPWHSVPSHNLLATLEYHGLRKGSIRFDYGGRTKRIGAKLDEHDTEQLLGLLRAHMRQS